MQNPPLVTHCKNGNLEEVQNLINNGANIHMHQEGPLRWACARGHLEIVQFLVNNGSYIHFRKDLPLYWAVSGNHLEVVTFLVESGANINAKQGRALARAIAKGYQDFLANDRLLIAVEKLTLKRLNEGMNHVDGNSTPILFFVAS